MVEKDLGFVIKRFNFRETSIIASIYTSRFGKISGILKGFYTSKKEFSSSLGIPSLNEFLFYPKKRELWLVSFADLIIDYPYVRTDVSKARVAARITGIIDATMQLWDHNIEVYNLIMESLDMVGRHNEVKVFYAFLIKFLTCSGFKPHLDRCILCEHDLSESIFFSVSKGGLVCVHCKHKISDAQKISRETSQSLLYIEKHDFSKVFRLRTTDSCQDEIHYILGQFLKYHLDYDIKNL